MTYISNKFCGLAPKKTARELLMPNRKSKNMKHILFLFTLLYLAACQPTPKEKGFSLEDINTVYKAAPEGVATRWISSENKNGEKGQAGMTNKGAKGDAFTMIGVIGNELYRGTWFGEGEVKIYLDGDTDYPTLSGTGTEDYIGTGWGQGEYINKIQGSTVSNKEHDIYTFYRFHTYDPVYFHEDCRVTIQQIGNSQKAKIIEMNKNGADHYPRLDLC